MCPAHIIKQNYTRMMEKVPSHGNKPILLCQTNPSDPFDLLIRKLAVCFFVFC
jgi:hypothetical protein